MKTLVDNVLKFGLPHNSSYILKFSFRFYWQDFKSTTTSGEGKEVRRILFYLDVRWYHWNRRKMYAVCPPDLLLALIPFPIVVAPWNFQNGYSISRLNQRRRIIIPGRIMVVRIASRIYGRWYELNKGKLKNAWKIQRRRQASLTTLVLVCKAN
jgi:hypothetical protein